MAIAWWRVSDGALKRAATRAKSNQRLPGSINPNRPLQSQLQQQQRPRKK